MATRPRFRVLLLELTVLIAVAAGARAGVELRIEASRVGDDTPARVRRLWIEGRRLRLDPLPGDASAHPGGLLYDGDDQRLWLLDGEAERALELDRASVDALAERLASARREVETRLAALPPSQRAAARRVLPSRGERPALTLAHTAAEREIDARPATRVDLLRGDEKVGEIWVVPWRHAPVRRRPVRALASLAAFARYAAERLGGRSPLERAPVPFEVFDRLDGWPLEITQFQSGRPAMHVRIAEAREVAIEPASFEPPAGYVVGPFSSP
ncbi:MAG: hypothetical protein MJE66_08740 [Proteobacteria bacterium]|nr:hypothetical protein [Pseudomonadota bacterium]